MENRTEFSIDKSIINWKSQLSKKVNFTGDNINELESHLLDEIQGLKELGLNDEESFLVAIQRLGSIDQLTSEFSKVNQKVYFRSMVLPYLKGILMFIAFMTITELLTNTSILLVDKLGLNDSYYNWVSIGLLISLSIFPFALFYKKYKNENFNMRNFTNIPILVITIIVAKFLTIYSLITLTHSIEISSFGITRMNFGYFELFLATTILIASSVIFYVTKKDRTIKAAE
ncbi:permease prefix domain 1-containing protein [Cellulophaga sp. L1A9]|uniref:permease prefix domain 1-containing protein n=1 Tax=Cellulophaga sp. L1A9 TaxID=2686362 RepID=UPI00131DF557|nr:permease prefix domain 1-containing protein [Cellulophaga sp. L1A9]